MDASAHKERFWRPVLWATLPLLVWIGHFAFSYGLTAAQCSPAVMRPGGPDRVLLAAVSVGALGACALLAWRACRILRRASQQQGRAVGLADRAALLLAVLALIAIAWSGIPLLLVVGCA
jgi:hypothetical protein